MNASEINSVVNNLCVKLGIGINEAKELITSLARYKIAVNSVVAVQAVVFIAIALIIIYKWYKEVKENEFASDLLDGLCFASVIIGVVQIVLLFLSICSIIGWVYSPDVKAIEYVIDLIG